MTTQDATKTDLQLQRIAFVILIALAVIATIIFGVFGYRDTNEIISKIYEQSDQHTPEVASRLTKGNGGTQLGLTALLEIDTINARNRRASSILATTTWLRFVTVMFGAILTVIGGAVVLTRVTSDSIQLAVEAGKTKGTFGTTSPGLVMVLFGALLIGWGLYIADRTSVVDGAIYGRFFDNSTNAPGAEAGSAPGISDEEVRRILTESGIDVGE